MRTHREWEARLRLRRTELKVLLAAADDQIMNELFHVAMAAAPDHQCSPVVSHFAQRQWARAFVGSEQESWDVKVARLRDLIVQTYGEEIQRRELLLAHPRCRFKCVSTGVVKDCRDK